MTYLKIENVNKHFDRGGTRSDVLKDISLNISQGEVISIIGHSGCGKSTLLNLIAGLTEVSSGGIQLEGREVNGPGPERAVVFQPFAAALAHRLRERQSCRHQGLRPDQDRRRTA